MRLTEAWKRCDSLEMVLFFTHHFHVFFIYIGSHVPHEIPFVVIDVVISIGLQDMTTVDK